MFLAGGLVMIGNCSLFQFEQRIVVIAVAGAVLLEFRPFMDNDENLIVIRFC